MLSLNLAFKITIDAVIVVFVVRAIPHWRAYMAKKLILFQQDETFTGDVKNI